MHAPTRQVVVAGYFGFGSAGDEAILASLRDTLRGAAQPIRLAAISGNCEQTSAAYNLQACGWSDAVAISEMIRLADAVVIAGGTLFDPSAAAVVTAGMATTRPAFLVPAVLSAIHHKPLFLYGIGLDDIASEVMRQSLLAVCRAASLITVSNQITHDLLVSLGITASRISIAADPVWAWEPRTTGSAPLFRKPALGIALAAVRLPIPESDLRAVLDQHVEESGGSIMFAQLRSWPNPDIASVTERLRHSLARPQNTFCVDGTSPESLFDGLAACDALIADDRQAAVFGLLARKPVLMIGCSPGIRELRNDGLDGLIADGCMRGAGQLAPKLRELCVNAGLARAADTAVLRMRQRANAGALLLLHAVAQPVPCEAACSKDLIALGLGLEPGMRSPEPAPRSVCRNEGLTECNGALGAVIEDLQKRVQEAERLQSETAVALDIYQAQLDAELRMFQGQRAWKVMLYLRKAYTVIVRGIQTGKFPSVGALMSLVFAPSKNLDCYDLRFPNVKHAMPQGLQARFKSGAEQFAARPVLPDPGAPHRRRHNVPRQQNYDVLILPLFEFDTRYQRQQHLAIQFANAGHRVFWVSPSRNASTDQPYEAVLLQPRLWEIRLRTQLPDIYSSELESKHVQDAIGCIERLYRDFAISECCTLALIPFWRCLGLALREAFVAQLVYDCTDDWKTIPALGDFDSNEEARFVADADLLMVPEGKLLECERAAERAPVLVAGGSDFESWRVMDDAIRKMFPLVSVLIVTHNSAEYVSLCLEALLRNTSYPSYEVVVVDNASRDLTIELLEAFSAREPRLRIIRNHKNVGFAAANNLAAGLANGEYLVLLNIDTIPSPGWIMRLVRHCVRHSDIGLVIPVTNYIGNEAKVRVPYVNLTEMEEFAIAIGGDRLGESRDLSTGPLFCALLPRNVWNRVGPLDERFRVGMFEDDDFSLRIRRSGFRIALAEDCFVHHFGQGSFAKLAPADYQEVFATNRRLFEEEWQIEWEPHKYRPGITADEGKFRPSDFAGDPALD